MDKSTTKFCPDCGHHLYKVDWVSFYFCNICAAWHDADEALTLEQAQPIRDANREAGRG